MIETNKIINGDCVEVMTTMPENSVDLIVTSPPYGVGIEYDTFNDDLRIEDYKEFSKKWLTQVFRVLKDDGLLCFGEWNRNSLNLILFAGIFALVFKPKTYWEAQLEEHGFTVTKIEDVAGFVDFYCKKK